MWIAEWSQKSPHFTLNICFIDYEKDMVTNVGNICEVWTVFDHTLSENHIKMAWA